MCARIMVAFALFAFTAANDLRAYSQSGTSSGVRLRWPSGTLVRYHFNRNFTGPNSPPNNSELVRAAVASAMRTLEASMPQQSGVPLVRFEDAGTTDVNRSASDGVNLITFTDPDPADQLPSGVIAQAHVFALSDSGQIVQVDMLFSTRPDVRFSTSQHGDRIFDIEAIALHEAGHWLGLGHTGILAAAMSPYGDSGEFPSRRLHSDDGASLIAAYTTGAASLSGRVNTADGAAVKGAHVVAVDAATGLDAASALTGDDGTYRIVGLRSGNYRVFAEPLDEPARVSDMPDYVAGANSDFVTTFFGGGAGTTVSAAASNVNITVTTPRAMNLTEVGIVPPGIGMFSFSNVPHSVRRGTSPTLFLRGTGTSGDVRFSSPKITLRGPVRSGPAGGVFADIQVGADAATGPTDIYFGSSSFTGGLIVTVNPALTANSIVEGAAFNQGTSGPHFAPGSIISIFGGDVAEQTAAASAIPLPTQLGGVSVRIGNQLAPLYFVSAGQINAMIPFELAAGSNADVQVIAGNESESATITIPLAASAPRIFTFSNTQGDAIAQNFSKSGNVVNSANPAAQNDVLVIYLTGMGETQARVASGLASPANIDQISLKVLPIVTIDGQPCTVDFAGLTPGLVGLYQVNLTVPPGVRVGRVPLVVRTAAGTSNTSFLYTR